MELKASFRILQQYYDWLFFGRIFQLVVFIMIMVHIYSTL